MNARRAIISDIFNNATLIEIPFFQRSYVWKEDLWGRLLEDMEYIVKSNRPHFFGSIILKEGRAPIQGDQFSECKTVVDGQQRLTTLLIFFKVLCLKTRQAVAFDSQFRIRGTSIALLHGKNDIEAFELVMSKEDTTPISDENAKSRIIDAYNYFLKQIDETKLDYIKISNQAQFVRIDLDADEDEQQIFDTINSLGVNLTTSELLKNYFFSRDTIDEYNKKWVSVFESDDEVKEYWDTEIETGRVKRALIDIFFDSYFQLFIQNRQYSISNEDKIMYSRIDTLSQSYQHFITNYCNGDKNVILGQMKDYAVCFRQTIRPDFCKMCVPGTFGIERLNVVIFGLKTATLIPYVLYVAKNVYDEEERNKMYGLLEGFVMRRMVVHASTKNYNNLFTSLIRNKVCDAETLAARLTSGNDASTYNPANEEIKKGFLESKLVNLQSRGVLYLIESHIRPSGSSTSLLGFDSYSLEHLMPKKWRNKWSACASEEDAKNRDSILLTLGNLAIITQALNSSIRDEDWSAKRVGKANKPGLNVCAAGLVTIHDALQKDDWKENDIKARAEWLYEKAVDVWKL